MTPMDNNNKTYCKMPFVGFQNTYRGNRLCCVEKGLHNGGVKEFWSSEYIQDVRKKMTNGDRVAGCQQCYDDEDQGKVSLRNHYNARYKDHKMIDTPTALDLDFSNFCNLQCIMCGPNRSSQWAKELGDKRILSVPKDRLQEICDISWNVRHISIQGGEPSIMPEFEHYFDFLKKNNLISNIEIDCISNLTNVNNKFYTLLEDFKQVNLNASIDSYGKANDYIRYPSNFEKIEKNLEHLMGKNLQVNLQITLQVLSMFNFYDFLQWIFKMQTKFADSGKNLGLNLSYVTNIKHLDIQFAPMQLKTKMLFDIDRFTKQHRIKNNLKFNLELKNLKNSLSSNSNNTYPKELSQYIHTLDSRRNIKITNYIPNFYDNL